VNNDALAKQGHFGNLNRISLNALKQGHKKEIVYILPHVKH